MANLRIKGGNPVKGTFLPRGNKNAVLPMLAASLLTDQKITLNNIPLIEDVGVMLELLSSIGVSVELNDHTVTLEASTLKFHLLMNHYAPKCDIYFTCRSIISTSWQR